MPRAAQLPLTAKCRYIDGWVWRQTLNPNAGSAYMNSILDVQAQIALYELDKGHSLVDRHQPADCLENIYMFLPTNSMPHLGNLPLPTRFQLLRTQAKTLEPYQG